MKKKLLAFCIWLTASSLIAILWFITKSYAAMERIVDLRILFPNPKDAVPYLEAASNFSLVMIVLGVLVTLNAIAAGAVMTQLLSKKATSETVAS